MFEGPKPVWVDKRTLKPLPACQFSPRFCREESLLVLHNAKSLFRVGSVPANGSGLEVHSSIVSCNEDGFYLAKNDAPMKNKKSGNSNSGSCSNRHVLSCKEGEEGLGTWFDESGHPTYGKELTCKKGEDFLTNYRTAIYNLQKERIKF
jgi:hypothetical protein